jgi:hypothetical protein
MQTAAEVLERLQELNHAESKAGLIVARLVFQSRSQRLGACGQLAIEQKWFNQGRIGRWGVPCQNRT